jgi:hypothetical protein
MAIDPDQVEQFIELDDGSFISASQISLNFACRSCHNPDGFAPEVTDEQLQEVARDYHMPVPVEEVPAEEAAAGTQ